MSWNWDYRVIEKDCVFAIHEVYSEGDKIVAISEDSINLCSNSLDELKDNVHLFTKAIERPVLSHDDIDLC